MLSHHIPVVPPHCCCDCSHEVILRLHIATYERDLVDHRKDVVV